MGTCHSDVLNTLSKQLWLWWVSRNIWMSTAHIAGKSNQQADLESRQKKTETEWMLFPRRLIFRFEAEGAVHPLCSIQARPRCGCHRYFFPWLIHSKLLHLSSFQHDSSCFKQNKGGQSGWGMCAAELAHTSMLSSGNENGNLWECTPLGKQISPAPPSQPDATHLQHKQLSLLVSLLSGKPNWSRHLYKGQGHHNGFLAY